MGNYRFRLSDMMPNAWFYKLKDMGKGRSMKPNVRASKTVKPCSSPTKSQTNITSAGITNSKLPSENSSVHHYPTSAEPLIRFTDPLYSSPRNCSRASDARSSASPSRKSSHVHTHTRNKRPRIYKQNNDTSYSADQPIYYSLSSSELGSPEASYNSKPNDGCRKSGDFGVELLMFDELGSWSSSSLRSSCSCCCRISSSTADIIIDLNHHQNQNHQESVFSRKFQQLNEFDAASELELRPILTKPPEEPSFEPVDTTELCSSIKNPAGKESHLIIGDNNRYVRKLKSRRPSLSESFAIVKSSIDPQRDFQESMMEMILENNLNGFKDLESLLACYLSLNCKEYHPLIVNAFEQIFLDIFCST